MNNEEYLRQLNQQNSMGQKPSGGGGSLLSTILSTGGSIGGGILGTILAPGIGTAAGGAAGGGLGRGLSNLIEGRDFGDGVLGEAALGTLGGIGKGVKATTGAIKAARSGEGAKSAFETLRYGRQGAQAARDLGEAGTTTSRAVEAFNANRGTGSLRGKAAEKLDEMSTKAVRTQMSTTSKRGAANATQAANFMKKSGYTNVADYSRVADDFMNAADPIKQTAIGMSRSPVDMGNFMVDANKGLKSLTGVKPHQKKNLQSLVNDVDTNLSASATASGKVAPGAAYEQYQVLRQAADDALPGAGYAAASGSEKQAYNFLRQRANDLRDKTFNALGKDGKIPPAMKQDMYENLVAGGVDSPQMLKQVQGMKTWKDFNKIEANLITARDIGQETLESKLSSGIRGGKSDSLAGMGRDLAVSTAMPGVARGAGALSSILGRGVAGKEASTLADVARQTGTTMGMTQAIPRLMTGGGEQPQQAAAVDPMTGMPTQQEGMMPSAAPGMESAMQIPGSPMGQSGMGQAMAGSEENSQQSMYPLENLVQDLQANPQNADILFQLYSLANPEPSKESAAVEKQQRATDAAMGQLDLMEQSLSGIGGGMGPLGHLTNLGNRVTGGALNPNQATYDAAVGGLSAQFLRALGESGAMSDRDIERAQNLMPRSTDSPQAASQKLAQLRALVSNAGGL